MTFAQRNQRDCSQLIQTPQLLLLMATALCLIVVKPGVAVSRLSHLYHDGAK